MITPSFPDRVHVGTASCGGGGLGVILPGPPGQHLSRDRRPHNLPPPHTFCALLGLGLGAQLFGAHQTRKQVACLLHNVSAAVLFLNESCWLTDCCYLG